MTRFSFKRHTFPSDFSSKPPNANRDGHCPVPSHTFPVPSEKFPCSVAQGIDQRRQENQQRRVRPRLAAPPLSSHCRRRNFQTVCRAQRPLSIQVRPVEPSATTSSGRPDDAGRAASRQRPVSPPIQPIGPLPRSPGLLSSDLLAPFGPDQGPATGARFFLFGLPYQWSLK